MIALAGPDLPHEILHAAACHAGPIAFDPDRATPRAEEWLESRFAPWTRSVLEYWIDGRYDGLQAVLFSRADDSSQRLYYYICELQRAGRISGPEALILDIAKIPRQISRDRIADQLQMLCTRLSVTPDQLEAAIQEANSRRSKKVDAPAGPRCMLTGTPPPDRRLHSAIEEAGFVPVGPTLAEDWSDEGAMVEEHTADPIGALADQIHTRRGGPRSFADPAALLEERIRNCGAEAVILWRIEEDEAQCWHLPAELRALEKLGVPHLVMTRRDWLARDGATAEIDCFLKEICS